MRKVKTIEKIPYLAPEVLTKVIPSPTDGWDAISPLSEMDPKRAVILDNWVPRPGFVELRGGYIPYSSVLNDVPVETLMVYRAPTGEEMYAAGGTEIVDVNSPNSPVAVVTGLSNARWQYINFTPGGGTNVIQLCNGVDTLRQYNGTTWSAPAVTGLPSGSTTSIVNINSQKRRIWYVLKDTSIAAFMPTDAITGPIDGTQDFGSLWTKGGYLVAMGAWTIDGGSGPQDYAVFISSRGQITLYSGTDPTDSANWQLVGTFDASPPIGRRCLLRVGSDMAIITQAGVVPLSQVLPFDPSADRSVAITARIQNAMATVTLMTKDNFGWQLIAYPAQQLAVLNVPLATNLQQQQYVMNTLTGAWCRFIGWEANCFEIFEDNLYFGDNNGGINLAYMGSSDAAMSIQADMQCAFNWLEEPGRTKRMTMIQPLLQLSPSITPTIAVDTDFKTSTATAPISVATGGAVWNIAVWDVDLWSALSTNFGSHLSVKAIGHCHAIRMRVNLTGASAANGTFDVGLFDSLTFDQGFDTQTPILQVNVFNTIYELGGPI